MSILDQAKTKMNAVIEHLKVELKSIRTGRANPGMLDHVVVHVYDTDMRIKDLASITTPEPRQIQITPFDASNKNAICKAIEKANLGIQPIVDGNNVRIKIAPMDEAQRKEMIKLCNKRAEEAKVGLRNVRRDANEVVRKQKGEGTLAEDEAKKLEKQIQDLTDKFVKDVEEITRRKETEVSTI